jgi:hypothetical protein
MLKLPLYAIVKMFALAGMVMSTMFNSGIPFQDPWFDVAVFMYVFSGITAGMPEPTSKSSFFYVWAYRTFHILSANGTDYFVHKKWVDEVGETDLVGTEEGRSSRQLHR